MFSAKTVFRVLAVLCAAVPPMAGAAEPAAGTRVYATDVARSFTFLYQMQRGGIRGSSEFGWKRSGDRYEAHLKGNVAGFAVLDWASSGGFDAAGVAPRRYVEHRIGKSDRDVVFRKDESKISFSGTKSEDIAFVPGVQDRLSWMVQLPAILAADPAKTKVGTRIGIYVVGTRGRADTWVFESAGSETIKTGAGTVRSVRWSRRLRTPDDTQADVWVDPARKFLPVRLRLTLPPLDGPLEFTLTDANW